MVRLKHLKKKEQHMNNKKQWTLLAASVAGLVASIGLASLGSQVQAAEKQGDEVHCYGINKCKGMGDCAGKSNACAGKNGCQGQGYLKLQKETCLKIKDGRLTPAPTVS